MIYNQLLIYTNQEAIADTDVFLVKVQVKPDNSIIVELDSDTAVDIDTCADLTRRIEETFDRDVEDYELEVGSAGLTSPFKIRRQYVKNIGNEVEVLTGDGRKLKGVLTEVGDDDFTIEVSRKAKEPGQKRPVIVNEPLKMKFTDNKYVKYLIQFK